MSDDSKPQEPSAGPHDGGSLDPLDDLLAKLLCGRPETLLERLDDLCGLHPDHAAALRRRVEVLRSSGLLEEPPAPLAFEQLGEFQLLETIGEGAMGIVHRARQRVPARDVAVKLVRPEELRFSGARERFRREVETIAKLSHPGIVPVYAVGEDQGVPYFAMELVHGETLAALLEDLETQPSRPRTGSELEAALAGALGEEPAEEAAEMFAGSWEHTATRIVRAIADALQHAHQLGVVHRDVKPSNVMITRAGRVMLLDFGLSSTEGSQRLTRSGAQVGSWAYMAPEVFAGRAAAGPRSDVYALGATFYELLCGRLPYSGKTLAELRERVLEARPPALRKAAPMSKVSWEVETVCLVALDPDPARRYATAGDMAADLGRVLAGRPIQARRAGPLLRARRFIERHPAWSAGGLLLAVAVPLTWAIQERSVRMEVEFAKQQVEQSNRDLDASLVRERLERTRAERHFELAVSAVDRMLTRVAERNLKDVPRAVTLRRELLEDALSFHEELLETAPQTKDERFEYARAQRRTGQIRALLGDYEGASDALLGALDALKSTDGNALSPVAAEEAGAAYAAAAEVASTRGQLDEAVRIAREGIALLGERPKNERGSRIRAASIELQLGRSLQRLGERDAAQTILTRAAEDLSGLREQGSMAPEELGVLGSLFQALGTARGIVDVSSPLPADALEEHHRDLEYLEQARLIRTEIATAQPTPENRFALAETTMDVAGFRVAVDGPSAQPAQLYARAAQELDRLVQEFPSVTAYRDAQASNALDWGNLLQLLGELEGALALYQGAVDELSRLHERLPGQRGLGIRRLVAMLGQAQTRMALARADTETLELVGRSVALAEQLARSEVGQGAEQARLVLGRLRELHGEALVEVGDFEGALRYADELVEDPALPPRANLTAAATLAMCVAESAADEELRETAGAESVACVARALDSGVDRSTLAVYLRSSAFDPLREDAALMELLDERGLAHLLEKVGR